MHDQIYRQDDCHASPVFLAEAESKLLQIRESIKNLFPNRDCFSLVRPMSDESQLAKLETIPPEQMRPQFIEVSLPTTATATNLNPSVHLHSDQDGRKQSVTPPAR